MKVKEFIEQLQQLDQDKDIHIIYDTFFVFDPEVEVADEDYEKPGGGYKYRKGDYVMYAG